MFYPFALFISDPRLTYLCYHLLAVAIAARQYEQQLIENYDESVHAVVRAFAHSRISCWLI